MDIISEIKKYYISENHTQQETCNFFNITYSNFRKLIDEYNIKKQPKNRSVKKVNINKEEAYNYYIIENHTAEESAKHFQTNYRTFMRWMKRYNIIKENNIRIQNMYKTNIEKYGSKTFFGTKTFKEWRKTNIEDIMKKAEQTFIEKYGVKSYVESCEAKNIWKMGTSKTENDIYNILITKFPDTILHYTSKLYPFNCDYYIPSKDLYIEYQGYVTHNKKPFDKTNNEHLKEMFKLMESSKEIDKDILYIWTIRDPYKREYAKNNNLNWIEFFDIKQFMKWFREQ